MCFYFGMKIQKIQQNTGFKNTQVQDSKKKPEFIDKLMSVVQNQDDVNDCVAVPRGIFKAYLWIMGGFGLIGIGGARFGFPVMDSIASLVIFVFIVKAAYDIFKDAMDKMLDHSCDEETEKQIYDCVMKNEHVRGIDLLQTRIFGNKIYVDVEIQLYASYTLEEAHNIAETVHNAIEDNFPKVKHIMVHVNPVNKGQ